MPTTSTASTDTTFGRAPPLGGAALLIEHAPLPLIEVQGSAHLITAANAAFCRLLERPRTDFIGKPFAEVIQGGERCVPLLDRAYATGTPATHVEVGPEPAARCLYAMWPVLDADQKPVGLIVQMTQAADFQHNAAAINEALLISALRQHELTEAAEETNKKLRNEIVERARVEELLRISETRYRRQFEAAQEGVLILDQGTRKITDANPYLARLLGYSREELLGLELWQIGLLKDEAASQAAFLELQAKEFIRYEDLPLQTKSGERREVEFISNLYDEGGQKVMQCRIRDITERKRVEEALRATRSELVKLAAGLEVMVTERTLKLQETIQDLETFSYSLTHDLRAPLRSMQSFATILADECASQITGSGTEYIRRIVTSADRMDTLIRDALNYSAVIQSHPEVATVKLGLLLRGIIESYPAFQPPRAEIMLEGDFPEVLGSEAGLTQCISNLLGNAIKFVADGVAPRVRVWAEKNEGVVRLCFQDNGIGIEKDFQEKIFGLFQRLNPKVEGTGAGLAIVRKAMERMNGAVGLESEPGEGSTFWLELPLATTDAL